MDALTKTDSISNTECEIEQRRPSQLRCPGCYATVDARCDCGLSYAYVPAGVAAAKAVAANPDKSDRAIAADLGVDHKTVGKQRKATGEKSPVDEKRKGLDGKDRRVPDRKAKHSIPEEQAYLGRVDRAIALAKVPYKGRLTDEAIRLARSVADAWNELADKLESNAGC